MPVDLIDLTSDDDGEDVATQTPPEVKTEGPEPCMPQILMVESLAGKSLASETEIAQNASHYEPKTKRIKLEAVKNINPNYALFQQFVNKCMELENDPTDRTAAEFKLKSCYNSSSSDYKKSEEFGFILKQNLQILEPKKKEKLYYCIREVVDNLKYNTVKRIKPQPVAGTSRSATENVDVAGDEEISSDKVQKRIDKLVEALRMLHVKIQELETTEVNFEDEDNSAYLKLCRYRARFNKIYKKLCEITGKSVYARRITKRKLRFRGTCFADINVLIERWINKKKQFPDYNDVYNLVKSKDPQMKPDTVKMISEKAFSDIGEQMKKLRTMELWDSIEYFTENGEDPADKDPQLANALAENYKIFRQQEREVMNYYVKRQMESKDSKELEEDKGEDEEEEEEDEGGDTDVSSVTSEIENGDTVKEASTLTETLKEKDKIQNSNGVLTKETEEIIILNYAFVHYDWEQILRRRNYFCMLPKFTKKLPKPRRKDQNYWEKPKFDWKLSVQKPLPVFACLITVLIYFLFILFDELHQINHPKKY